MTREILLVEDDADDAELFRIAASEAGLGNPIRLAKNGGAALELLLGERLSPSLILLDLKMPGIGGFEVLRRLREDPARQNDRVFVLSSSNLESDQIEALRLGCERYLVKPASYSGYVRLAAEIKAALS